ncbi:MAG: hypothetical protein LAO79_03345 [Acidobacteriia bacterium]|nr:hypothetical protein [Terriglobia bacterium]
MSSPTPAIAMKKPARALKLRAANLSDYSQIAALECRFGLASRSYEEWSHVWLANPAYRERENGWNIGWVLEEGGGRIVGSMGNVPLAYECGGKRLLAASGRSWVVEPEYRSLSLQLLDRVVNQPDIDVYLNTSVSTSSIDSVNLFECSRVPVGSWDQSAFWVTKHRAFFESVLVKRHGALLRPLTYPLSAAFRFKDWMSQSAVRAHAGDVESCSRFDARFDDFWEALRERYPRVFLAVRTREILDWHFHVPLRDRSLWIGAVVSGRSIQAYAIFDRNDNRKSGMTRVRLVDFQSLDGDVWLPSLLSWALRRCGRENVHVLESTGRWMEPHGFMRKAAPYRRKLNSWTFFYRAARPELAEHLKDPAAWAPTLFDGDASF